MAYIINQSDGTEITIQDNSADTSQFSIALLGQNFVGYSDEIATNFVHMLENFSHNIAPVNPTRGQLWWHSTDQYMSVYNGSTWTNLTNSVAESASTAPPTPAEGSLWFDDTTNSLKIYDGAEWEDVGAVISGSSILGHEPPVGTADKTNVALGKGAMPSSAITDTWHTVAIGTDALSANTSNDNTVAIGFNAGRDHTGALPAWANHGVAGRRGKNTLVGSQAGEQMIDSHHNVAVGYKAMEQSFNDGFGGGTGNAEHHGSVAVGAFALWNTAGKDNVAIGRSALADQTNGNECTAIGTFAGRNLATSDSVIAIGFEAGTSNSLSDNIIIGNQADAGLNGSNQIVIGHGIEGTADDRVHIGNASGHIYADYLSTGAWTATSDERLKTNIKEDSLGLNFITKLQPVTYNWKDLEGLDIDTETVMHGLIAQDVKRALEEVGCDTFNGHTIGKDDDNTQRVSREMFIMPLINAVKELSKENDLLTEHVVDLNLKFKQAMDKINELEKKINE